MEDWKERYYELLAHIRAAEDIIGRRNYCELDDWLDDLPVTPSRLCLVCKAEALSEE